LVPVLWGFVASTPAGTRDLYRIGILSKSGAARRLSEDAADTRQNGPYRERALKELSTIFPTADPSAGSAVANLRKIVTDPDPVFSGLRSVASEMLLKISPETAVESLAAELSSPDSTLRQHAAVKLSAMGQAATKASAALKNAMNDSNSTVSDAAAEALVKVTPELAIPKLIENLKNSSWQVRQKAAQMLGEIGQPARDAVPALEKVKRDPDIDVRKTVASALHAIDPTGHPTVRVESASNAAVHSGNISAETHEILPEGTYRVSTSDNLSLRADQLSIELERSKTNTLVGEVNRLAREYNEQRSRYNGQVNEVNRLGSQLNSERQFLDRTNQFAVNNYNFTVQNYNSATEQLRMQQQQLNQAADSYNTSTNQLREQRSRLNQAIDDYNQKLQRLGRR
jgi:hypothetical protein